MKYSQNNEQGIIVNYFGERPGRFLDIGAYDGKTFSNTFRLLELGWRGVLVEPSPTIIPLLRNNVEPFGSNAQVMAYAIGESDGRVTFYDNGGAVATTKPEHAQKWSKATAFQQCEVNQITPATLLDLSGENFDFLNIDVEGANIEVMRAMPWHRLRGLTMVCVEHDGHQREIIDILEEFDFMKLHENGENLILSR